MGAFLNLRCAQVGSEVILGVGLKIPELANQEHPGVMNRRHMGLQSNASKLYFLHCEWKIPKGTCQRLN